MDNHHAGGAVATAPVASTRNAKSLVFVQDMEGNLSNGWTSSRRYCDRIKRSFKPQWTAVAAISRVSIIPKHPPAFEVASTAYLVTMAHQEKRNPLRLLGPTVLYGLLRRKRLSSCKSRHLTHRHHPHSTTHSQWSLDCIHQRQPCAMGFNPRLALQLAYPLPTPIATSVAQVQCRAQHTITTTQQVQLQQQAVILIISRHLQ